MVNGLSDIIFWAFFNEQPAIRDSSSTDASWKNCNICSWTLGSKPSSSPSESNSSETSSTSLSSSELESLLCSGFNFCAFAFCRTVLLPFAVEAVEKDCGLREDLLGTADNHLVRLELDFASPLLSRLLFEDFVLLEGFEIFSVSLGLESTGVLKKKLFSHNVYSFN